MGIQRSSVVALAGALLLLSFNACSCDPGPESQGISADIALVQETGGPVDEIQFGEVPLDTTETIEIEVRALTQAPLKVQGLRFEAADEVVSAAFRADPAEAFGVLPMGSQTVKIHFSPKEPIPHEAELVVKSNDPDRPEIRIPLQGQGIVGEVHVISCLPNTEADPRRCADSQVEAPGELALGDVLAGDHAEARVSIINDGRYDLNVSGVEFADPAAAAAAGFSFAGAGESFVVKRGENAFFAVHLNPPASPLGATSATVVIQSDDRESPRIEVPISANVIPNNAPQACIFIREVRHADGNVDTYTPADPVPVVEPSDDVIFDAAVRADCTADPEDGANVALEWSVEGPDRSARIRSIAGEPLQALFGADVIGSYTVSLRATDRLGLVGNADSAGNPASVTFEVRPRRDIGVEISWLDDQLVDLDLHFVRGGAENMWTEANDLYWDNRDPQWGAAGNLLDDPAFPFDDKGTGSLVETALLNNPEASEEYWVIAHFFEDKRARSEAADCLDDGECGGDTICSVGKCMAQVDVSLKVFLKSEEVSIVEPGFLNPQPLRAPCDTWLAGRIVWPADGTGTPRFEATPSTVYPQGDVQGAICLVD